MAENPDPVGSVALTITEEKLMTSDQEPKRRKSIQIKHVMLPLIMFSFLLSLPILFSIIWLIYTRQYECEDLLSLPRLQIAIVIGLIIVFIVNNLVVYLRARFPVPGLLSVMVLLILMLIVGLGLVGAYKKEIRTIPGSPIWIETKVDNENNWNNIKSCIYETRTCADLASSSSMLTAYDFTRRKLSSIEFGCCKPPTSCGMEYVNATFWAEEEQEIDNYIPNDRDCDMWRNEENKLCYNCNACKEGFLRTLRGKWRKIGNFLVAMALLLIISHLILFVATMWDQYG
ncbi:tetraspanin-15-like [Rhododendron vialii]|uniref:tetraspanin-15-like n=1 Tax=Rhododendron vialii TaxID=182163 RepID=UPI00265E82DD|nr:tetraspanin-15-like [Rhododendron vialii]